jgi:rod shape determining protein RodA
MVAIIQALSIFTISSYANATGNPQIVQQQIRWILVGWCGFFAAAGFDYARLRDWAWIFYTISLFALIGVLFADPIVRVQRWYRLPGIGISIQPSESAKLALVFLLSVYLEQRAHLSSSWNTLLGACCIVGIPFLLILKQPDLGTAIVLYPMTLVIFFFGGIDKKILRFLYLPGFIMLTVVALTFSGIVSHETLRPYLQKFLHEYQCERFNPHTHHQRASQIAISVGGTLGKGWGQGEYWTEGYLPAPYTDSIFSSFGEEFGLLGLCILLGLYYVLIFSCFQTVAVAKDAFGRLISAGVAVYLAVHVIINVGMMTGCLPITGVPLVLMSYGGSSMVVTMVALGVTQSVYGRRFMF